VWAAAQALCQITNCPFAAKIPSTAREAKERSSNPAEGRVGGGNAAPTNLADLARH